MKSCPTCNRTFEDTLTYCLVDGAISKFVIAIPNFGIAVHGQRISPSQPGIAISLLRIAQMNTRMAAPDSDSSLKEACFADFLDKLTFSVRALGYEAFGYTARGASHARPTNNQQTTPSNPRARLPFPAKNGRTRSHHFTEIS